LNPAQAEQTQTGVAMVLAYLRGDLDGVATLAEPLMAQVSPIADALVFAAIVAGSSVAEVTGLPLTAVLDELTESNEQLVPDIPVRWDAVVELTKGVASANAEQIVAASARLDPPSAINSALSLAVSAARKLEAVSEVPLEVWLQTFAIGAEQEK
jgi:hypothetical protein